MIPDARGRVTDRPGPRNLRGVRDNEAAGRLPECGAHAEDAGKRWLRVAAGLLWAPDIEASVAPGENECMR